MATCPAPQVQALDAQAPACLEEYEESLEATKTARKRFERRVCDYRYAEIEDKGQVLADAYGPNGPMKPGGSYLFELRRWADAVQELNHECSKRQGDVCVNLLSYLRNYPHADQDANGGETGAASRESPFAWSLALQLLQPQRQRPLRHLGCSLAALGAGTVWAEALKLLYAALGRADAVDSGCFALAVKACGEAKQWERPVGRKWNRGLLLPALAADAWRRLGDLGEKKCFGEQAARLELLVVELSASEGSKVGVTVLSPHATIFSEHDRQQVKTAFTTQDAGPHWICIQNDEATDAEVLLSVLLGPEAKDYSQIAKKERPSAADRRPQEHLEESKVTLRRVADALQNYHSNVLYIRAREERMRKTNDSTASRVIFFCLFNVVLMIGVGGWQMLAQVGLPLRRSSGSAFKEAGWHLFSDGIALRVWIQRCEQAQRLHELLRLRLHAAQRLLLGQLHPGEWLVLASELRAGQVLLGPAMRPLHLKAATGMLNPLNEELRSRPVEEAEAPPAPPDLSTLIKEHLESLPSDLKQAVGKLMEPDKPEPTLATKLKQSVGQLKQLAEKKASLQRKADAVKAQYTALLQELKEMQAKIETAQKELQDTTTLYNQQIEEEKTEAAAEDDAAFPPLGPEDQFELDHGVHLEFWTQGLLTLPKSKVYNEIRLACEVGKKRAPLPNDSPVWCDDKTKLSCRSSCRHWWHEVHPLKAMPQPWVDDRIEYDQLKNICTAIERPQIIPQDLDRYQKQAEAAALHLRDEFCTPKWVDGYCEVRTPPKVHAKCTLENGQYCKKGLRRARTNEVSGHPSGTGRHASTGPHLPGAAQPSPLQGHRQPSSTNTRRWGTGSAAQALLWSTGAVRYVEVGQAFGW
eukprot:g14875.t1